MVVVRDSTNLGVAMALRRVIKEGTYIVAQFGILTSGTNTLVGRMTQ